MDPVSLILIIMFSLVGMALFASGKREQNMPHLVCGVLLMGYPYVVSGPVWIGLVGAALCTAAWLFRGF